MAFDLQTVLIEKINEAHLRAYCVRFDFGECKGLAKTVEY